MKVVTEKEVTLSMEKADLIEFVKKKMPDYDIKDIFDVDVGGFEKDGIIHIYAKLR